MKHSILNKLNARFPENPSTIAKDLKLNFEKLVNSEHLTSDEFLMLFQGVAVAARQKSLIEFTDGFIQESGFDGEMRREIKEAAAIVGMLNTYYRFRYTIKESDSADHYKSAGLRMMGIARPNLGKERFEMIALAVSIFNGCQSCIVAHEKTLREAGMSTEKIHEIVRLTAVMRGFIDFEFGLGQ